MGTSDLVMAVGPAWAPDDVGRAAGRWIGRRWPGRVVVPLARLAMCGPGLLRWLRIAPDRARRPRPGPIRPEYVCAKGCLLDSGRPSEDPRIDLDALVQPNLSALVAGLIVVTVALAVVSVVLVRRTGSLDARLHGMTRGAEGLSLEAVLDDHLDKVLAVSRQLDDVVARTAILESVQRRTFQRVGLVRYNPFEETGGDQSFALALLDAAGDGWILSSLHARVGTRVYAKAIKAGRSNAGLSAEEAAAIAQATA